MILRCERSDLLVSECAHCRPAAPASVSDVLFAEPDRRGPWFGASYPGSCAECGTRIDEGERIRADGEGGYLCDDCGEG